MLSSRANEQAESGCQSRRSDYDAVQPSTARLTGTQPRWFMPHAFVSSAATDPHISVPWRSTPQPAPVEARFGNPRRGLYELPSTWDATMTCVTSPRRRRLRTVAKGPTWVRGDDRLLT